MWYESWKDGTRITVKLTPRASRNSILGAETDWLRVALTAPPVDGKANDAAVRFLAEKTQVPRTSVALITGQTARLKRFYIPLPPETTVERLLAP